ncbi:MAG TPA: hydroxymethylglutaryl-CoA lyase, partial [Syntrophales bacterium]
MKQGLPKKVTIHEVVLRDGIQNERKLVPTEEKLRLVRELVACGVRRIEISSFVNPKLVPQMADAEILWERIERKKGILYSALILSEGGLERAIRCRVPHVGIFVSASETHSLKNSNRSVSEALKEAVRLIGVAQDAGMKVRAGVMNAFGCAYEGNVPVTRVLKLVRAFMKRGPDEICLADSSGLANPVQMEEVLARVRRETASADLSLHLHNTRGQGLANVYAALRQGVSIFDTSLGGLGGCPFIAGAR